MTRQVSFLGRAFVTPCSIEIEQTHEFFHAHLSLDGDVEIGPGDRVQLHGAPLRVRFGEKLSERRMATIHQANWLRRAWTKLTARFELQELYEVSFTDKRMP
jgi:hypothetical protein